MQVKPSIPKGTRDFSPEEIIRRELIISVIKNTFSLFGYQPLETPAMENLTTLLGKYGDEGDKLLFRILNSGDFLDDVTEEELLSKDAVTVSSKICEKGLRYDLTVPFARYVVQHRNEITFPFKRYQIQTVWRADRPQKGRYREFTQCDVDVIGSDSLINELELLRVIDEIFARLGVRVIIKINNRKILAGLAEKSGASDRLTDITTAIDKLEKAGMDAVIAELREKGLSQSVIDAILPVFELKGDNKEKLAGLRKLLADSSQGNKGIEELETLTGLVDQDPLRCGLEIDLSLARGLNYYTGAIIEVKADDVNIGSICGGGRYDNLTGIFGLEGVSGVGVSFGADRIYDVMLQSGKFENVSTAPCKVMIINFGAGELGYALKILNKFHASGTSAMIYPGEAKIGKQMSYANSLKIPFVAIAGEEEIAEGKVLIKNMLSGKQEKISLEDTGKFFPQQE